MAHKNIIIMYNRVNAEVVLNNLSIRVTLIKSYKRYYLGSLLWLNAFKFLRNEAKIQKWEQKHKERYKKLQQALRQYKFLKNFTAESNHWLNSKEFKAK